jgi:hypothetical protein
MDALKEGDKIFTEIAESVGWSETKSLKEASEFLKKLMAATNGLVIVDFLDSGNWDCIEGIETIDDSGYLLIHWRDYRNSHENPLDKEMRMLAFPASLYSSLIKFKELRIVKTRSFPVFLLRGYALKDKEINIFLSKGSSEFKIFDYKDNFSKLAVRKIDGKFESYTCLNTPIFSMIIIPKNCGSSAFASKKALLSYNLKDALLRLNRVKDELEKEDLVDEDIICEKSNSVRRIFEYVLKVELCYRYRQVSVKSDYSDLLLGDLMKLVKPFKEESVKDFLTRITVWSNELSHESGKPIKREKAVAISYMTILYTQLLESEMNLHPFPHVEE